MDLKTLLKINIALFSVVFLVHLYRIIFYFPVSIGSWEVPVWFNVLFLLISLVLILLNYKQMK
ncbi:MAG TPA: hypothetical protein VJG30_02220 [Candidatus Nanoarchaeia archaeon]|nr:hypothetical protein [Candidatus Nanoarchaeia archaeon]